MTTEADFPKLYTSHMTGFGDSYQPNGHSLKTYRLRRKLYRYALTKKQPATAHGRAVERLLAFEIALVLQHDPAR